MNGLETKQAIVNSLKSFADQPLADAATALFESLGYKSQKRIVLKPNTAKTFTETFAKDKTLNPDHALLADWQSVDFLFQLTEDEIKSVGQGNFVFEGKGKYNNTVIESYLFFAIALKNSEYTRTELSAITREINKLFRMPAMLLFRHGDTLTLSIIPRRVHKRDESKDVLEKVTLIKDIRIADPHRAHIEILHDLSLAELHEQHHFTNWSELQAAWQKTLDSSELNKRFFQEIANWYFWATNHVRFPKPKEIKDADAYKAQSLIRLITRLIFCWFVKEKGLLPEDLFNPLKLQALLKEGDKLATAKHTVYYKAILQNLFFATLNREMNTPDEPDNRKFRGRTRQKNGRDQHHMIHNVYRYENAFQDSKKAVQVFSDIPFLNGGLFECLDKSDEVRVDGFSDRDDNPLTVPDFLFFGQEREVDLSAVYGETRFRRAKVRGLIRTFYRYKFTITENTPIEEEIALDPELAGKVFENLLAAYNPETATTARKQTGSFFTPREIVNYMVDEALIAYLATKLRSATPSAEKVQDRLRHLFAYNNEPHKFTAPEVDALIAAIDSLKSLDPAVGSGAFPMGILHKLVFILGKLDPENVKWRERQRQRAITETEEAFKVGDKEERLRRLEDINEVFESNASDYGRKLYLIENCIYGVDIQPIAVQIAKMRFFISLIVDQKTDPKAENLGIRPLPNLETKFVAANTLIGIEKPNQQMLRNPQIDAKEKDLKEVRDSHFSARTPSTKAKWRDLDAKLRAEISELLKADGFSRETTQRLANWNPYDQNASADFYDSEWMFGITDGFDVVIGNPPYVSALAFARIYGNALREQLNARYESATGAYDFFVLFVEQGLKLCKQLGHLCFITPNKYLAAKYAVGLRGWILKHASLLRLLDVSPIPVFEEAAVYPVVSLFYKDGGKTTTISVSLPTSRSLERFETEYYEESNVPSDWLRMLPEEIWGFLLSRHVRLLPKLTQSADSLSKLGEVNATSTAAEADEYGRFLIATRGVDGLKVINTGTIDPYTSLWGATEMTHAGRRILTPYLPVTKAKVNERRLAMYRSPKIVFAKMAKTCEAVIDVSGEFASLNTNCFYSPRRDISLKFVGGVCNSRMFMFLYDLFFGALRMSGGYYQFQAPQLRVIPMARADAKQQKAIEDIVDRILAVKQKDPAADTSGLEREINQQVYVLYGLTPEEIKIVEEGE